MSNPPSFSFNLWHQPWIQTVTPQGTMNTQRLSIRACLEQAHMHHALYAPSPLAVCGMHRLLAAVLQTIIDPQSLDDIARLLQSGLIHASQLDTFEQQYEHCFDLFDATAPFLQKSGQLTAKPAKSPKSASVAYLFAEAPTGINRTLFWHQYQDDHTLCPACCVQGLLTQPAFARNEGKSYSASINGAPPPVYVLPSGATLFESFVLSLVDPAFQPAARDRMKHPHVVWQNQPSIVPDTDNLAADADDTSTEDESTASKRTLSAVTYLEGLLFPARFIRLYPEEVDAYCTLCGNATAVAVRRMFRSVGYAYPKESAFWQDPFVAYTLRQKGAPEAVRLQENVSLWGQYAALFLSSAYSDTTQRSLVPSVVRQCDVLIERNALRDDQLLGFRCIAMRGDAQTKVFEWIDETFIVPPALLTDDLAIVTVSRAVGWVHEGAKIISDVFFEHFKRRKDAKQSDPTLFEALRNQMVSEYWKQLARPFHEFILVVVDRSKRMDAEKGWANTVAEVATHVFTQTAEQTGSRGAALRRQVQAIAACEHACNERKEQWQRG